VIEKLIPVAENRYSNGVAAIPSNLEAPVGLVADTLKRPLRDLRISVTDRCNRLKKSPVSPDWPWRTASKKSV
jgi:hypothetical protein